MQDQLVTLTVSAILSAAILATTPEGIPEAQAGPGLAQGMGVLSVVSRLRSVEATMPAASNSLGNTSAAQILGKIFSRLKSQGFEMKFGGDVATALGLVQNNDNVMVRELPPLRSEAVGYVYLFYRLDDGRGYIVVRFWAEGLIAFRFDPDFNLVTAAARPNAQGATVITGALADKILNDELHVWKALADNMRN
jgi:hypothetical protein